MAFPGIGQSDLPRTFGVGICARHLEGEVALEAVKGEDPLIVLAERFDVHPSREEALERERVSLPCSHMWLAVTFAQGCP